MENQEKEEQKPAPKPIVEKDWLLETLVDIVNSSDKNVLPITINTHGFLVSGTLISGTEYFKLLAETFNSSPESKQAIIDMGIKVYKEPNEHKSPPSYLHLKDAKFFNTSGLPVPKNEGMLWRVRISEISGFSISSLSQSAD